MKNHMLERKDYRTQAIPRAPGVYVFRDRFREVIYVGKAKSLRKRLAHYFQPSRLKLADPKIRSLINGIEFYQLFEVRSEQEAILLESQLIKKHRPRYNVVMRDDKRFLLIKIDHRSPFPRLVLARLKKQDGCVYYGPFPHAGAVRETVDFLTRHFGLRSCTPMIPGEKERNHCLDHIVRYCSAPCVGQVTVEEYRHRMEDLIAVIEGNTREILVVLDEKMRHYSQQQNFETAARLRDVMANIKAVFGQHNRMFLHAGLTRHTGSEGLDALQEVLHLDQMPSVIECFDISNISGSLAVASMVCFVEGQSAAKLYRHYRIKAVSGSDDFAMMREVVERRYCRLQKEQARLPDLIVVDGGAGQVSAAHQVLTRLQLAHIPLIGLAKKEEAIYRFDQPEPLLLERCSPALKLLQTIRDEAHRFANTFHQDLRSRRIMNSLLDDIPGIGRKRKQELLQAFGSVKNLRSHDRGEILKRLPHLGERLAETIELYLQRTRDFPAAKNTVK